MTTALEALLQLGKLDEARASAEATLREKPGDRAALLTLAKLATFDGDLAKAGALAARATLDGVEDTDSLLVKAAIAAQSREDFEPAKELYERAIRELKAPRPEPYFGLGIVLASVGHFAAAEKPLRKAVELEPSVGQFHFHLARVLLAEEKLQEGLPHLEKALELNPLYPPVYEAVVYVLQEFGQLEAAEKVLREGLKLMPEHEFLLGLLSKVLVARGNPAEALAIAQKLAAAHPDDPETIGNLARLMAGTGHRDAALELVQKLEARGQATPQTHALEAMLLETKDPPDLDGAIAAYAAAARDDHGDWSSLNNLAHILLRREDGDRAENLGAAAEALEEARARAPHRLEPVLNLALVHAQLENTPEAKALAQEVIERAGAHDAELKTQAEKLAARLG